MLKLNKGMSVIKMVGGLGIVIAILFYFLLSTAKDIETTENEEVNSQENAESEVGSVTPAELDSFLSNEEEESIEVEKTEEFPHGVPELQF